MGTHIKDPDAILDYGFDWSDWLVEGEFLEESTWLMPEGISVADDSELESGESGSSFETTGSTTVWLSGGTHGEDYRVTNRVVTSQGRRDDRSHKIQVRNR